MSYRAKCRARPRQRAVTKLARERRRYTEWRRRLDAVQFAPLKPGLEGLLQTELTGFYLMLERQLSFHMYRPHVSMGWTTWEEKYRAKYCGIPITGKSEFCGLSAWLP